MASAVCSLGSTSVGHVDLLPASSRGSRSWRSVYMVGWEVVMACFFVHRDGSPGCGRPVAGDPAGVMVAPSESEERRPVDQARNEPGRGGPIGLRSTACH